MFKRINDFVCKSSGEFVVKSADLAAQAKGTTRNLIESTVATTAHLSEKIGGFAAKSAENSYEALKTTYEAGVSVASSTSALMMTEAGKMNEIVGPTLEGASALTKSATKSMSQALNDAKHLVGQNMDVSDLLHGINVHHFLNLPYTIAPIFKGSTVFRIAEDGKWLIRFDNAHATGATFPHININPRFTGVLDPHYQISNFVLDASSYLNYAAYYAQKISENVVVPAVIAVDGCSLASAISRDYSNGDFTFADTTDTALAIGGRMIGAASGGVLSSKVGAVAGGVIGMPLGPAGAVPCAAVFSIAAAFSGSIYGAYYGKVLAKSAAKMVRQNTKSTEVAEIECD